MPLDYHETTSEKQEKYYEKRGIIKVQYIKDCLSRNMSLRDIEKKYHVTDVLGEYRKHKQMYSQECIDRIMEEVYYDA